MVCLHFRRLLAAVKKRPHHHHLHQLWVGTIPCWTGIGAVGAFVLGIVFLGESMTPMRIAAAMLILSGLVLMRLSAAS